MSGETVLTERNPYVNIPRRQLQSGKLQLQTFWEGNPQPHDLDGVVFYRGCEQFSGLRGVIAAGQFSGSLQEFPFMELQNDDRTGGQGEVVLGEADWVYSSSVWLGVGVYDSDASTQLSKVLNLLVAVYLPGHKPIIVRAEDGQNTSVCSMLQIGFSATGISVTRDLAALETNQHFPTPIEVLAAYWNHHLWGNAK